jgi:hypothetical protein
LQGCNISLGERHLKFAVTDFYLRMIASAHPKHTKPGQEAVSAGKRPEWKAALSNLQQIMRERSLLLANLTMAMILWDWRAPSEGLLGDSAFGND